MKEAKQNNNQKRMRTENAREGRVQSKQQKQNKNKTQLTCCYSTQNPTSCAASSSQALDETHELNSTFTREEEEAAAALNAGHANDDDMPAGEAFDNDDPIAAAMRAAETEAAAVAHAAAAARTPARTPAAARTPARTPARALAAAVVESPKTPSLDDVGLSAAALSILQQTQPKRGSHW